MAMMRLARDALRRLRVREMPPPPLPNFRTLRAAAAEPFL
eukprot:gene462-10125_t